MKTRWIRSRRVPHDRPATRARKVTEVVSAAERLRLEPNGAVVAMSAKSHSDPALWGWAAVELVESDVRYGDR
jgi:hypothetical protein